MIKKSKAEFEDIINLKENLNSSVEMLGYLPVKSVVSREKIRYGKKNWLKYVMQKKEKFERVLNVDNSNIFKIVTHTSVCCFK